MGPNYNQNHIAQCTEQATLHHALKRPAIEKSAAQGLLHHHLGSRPPSLTERQQVGDKHVHHLAVPGISLVCTAE